MYFTVGTYKHGWHFTFSSKWYLCLSLLILVHDKWFKCSHTQLFIYNPHFRQMIIVSSCAVVCAVLFIHCVPLLRLLNRQVWAVQICDGTVTHPQCRIPSLSASYSSHGDAWWDAFCIRHEAPRDGSVWGRLTSYCLIMRLIFCYKEKNSDIECMRTRSKSHISNGTATCRQIQA